MERKAAGDGAVGLECPDCGCFDSRVYRTTKVAITVAGEKLGIISRQRVCQHCGRRFLTRERVTGS